MHLVEKPCVFGSYLGRNKFSYVGFYIVGEIPTVGKIFIKESSKRFHIYRELTRSIKADIKG